MDSNPLVEQVLDTLPPFVEGRDRRFHFESDGTLVYEREEGDWEPPRHIEGFETDPTNPWRLQSHWDACPARLYTAVRFPECGCIGIIARCNEPDANFTKQVKLEACKQCPLYREVRHGM